MTVLFTLNDGTVISKGRGKFDDWHITVNNKTVYDREYFDELKSIAKTYGSQKVYDDFVTVYDNTGPEVEQKIFSSVIPSIANTYQQTDYKKVVKLFSTLYAVMIAEENRPEPLKKRVKRIAAYQVLFLNFTAAYSSEYSKNINKLNILKDVHNLICSQKHNNKQCKQIDSCKFRDYKTAGLLFKICESYGF